MGWRREGQHPADWPTERKRHKQSQWNACPRENRHQPAACSSPRQRHRRLRPAEDRGGAGGVEGVAIQAAGSSAALALGATRWTRLSPASQSSH
eukprot:9260158-Alexandrium_andersonii.AAC.1